MYATNEEEDWVYLHQTPPVNTIFHGVVNHSGHERSSSSSSSITSCSSKSNRSVSLSSIASIELENAQNDDNTINTDVSFSPTNDLIIHHVLEAMNIADRLVCSDNDNHIQTATDTHLLSSQQLKSTPVADIKDILPSKRTISRGTDNPATDMLATVNEKDVFSPEFELSHRRRSGASVQETNLCNAEIPQRRLISQGVQSQKSTERYQNKNDTLITCTCIIVLLTLPFILGQTITKWDQSAMKKIATELDRTYQRLNGIQDIPLENIEEKLTKQLEEKLQNMFNQQLAWHDHEKSSFNIQIRELRQILNMTKQNLTDTIYRLTNENKRLQEQVKLFQRRLGVADEKHPKLCLQGFNCTNSSTSSLDKLVSNIFKQTASIAADTSINLSGLFEHLSASVSNLVDHRHEYVNRSRRKLTAFTGSSTAEKVQTSFRRSVENLSSSFRRAKSTYATWVKSRAQRREQIQKEYNQREQQQSTKKFPWRWVFQRDHGRERMDYQTSNKEHLCHSKLQYSMSKIRSMKDWMVKLFRP